LQGSEVAKYNLSIVSTGVTKEESVAVSEVTPVPGIIRAG